MIITILHYGRIYIGRIGQVTTLNRRSLSGGPKEPPYCNNLLGSRRARRSRRGSGYVAFCWIRCLYSSISLSQSPRSCNRYHLSYSGPHPFHRIRYCVEKPWPLHITRLSSIYSTSYALVPGSTGLGSSRIGWLYGSDPSVSASSSWAMVNTSWIFKWSGILSL
jgi:hypothetical protein